MKNTEINKEAETKKAIETSLISNLVIAAVFFVSFALPALLSEEGLNFHLNDCFYTEGLFERTGFGFIRAYLFELPFAIGRWCGNIGMLPFVLLFVIFAIYEVCKIRKEK